MNPSWRVRAGVTPRQRRQFESVSSELVALAFQIRKPRYGLIPTSPFTLTKGPVAGSINSPPTQESQFGFGVDGAPDGGRRAAAPNLRASTRAGTETRAPFIERATRVTKRAGSS